ncbi:glycosyltransferase [Pseudonocardia sp. HH130630-07]|uniref:glycosyltransferase n=1 Tax=Pseudonocardia sp. HH130630-07 TaxID=1690815 RepID=UPI000A858B40|nr:glycosyltransferase [Pseudonocardia sp. HH130630-07]
MRVASVPAGHPYVLSLADPGTHRLPDPPVPGAPAGQWWPARWLDPRHVRAHAAEFDVLHVHFGFDDRTPAGLAALVATLRELRRPLVLTVHDLRNPHHPDPARHDAMLDVLVPAADALVTLTPGAAAEIHRRWGRRARVLPHPGVVGPRWARRPRPERSGFTVGVHAKSHRTNADPAGVARALAETVRGLAATTVRVDAHDDERGRAVARSLDGVDGLDVRVHPPFDDDAFHQYLQELDVSVLPYRWGTHSGWLEACHDLGTTALVPDVGHVAEQGPCLVYRLGPDGPDRDSLAAAVRLAHRDRPVWRADPDARDAQRRRVAAAHTALYRELVARC